MDRVSDLHKSFTATIRHKDYFVEDNHDTCDVSKLAPHICKFMRFRT